MTGHGPDVVILLITLGVVLATTRAFRRGGYGKDALVALLMGTEALAGLYLSLGGHL